MEGLTDEMKNIARSILEDNGFTDDGDWLSIMIDADYRDEISDESIKEICQSKSPDDTFYEMFVDGSSDDSAIELALYYIKQDWPTDEEDYDEDDLRDYLYEVVRGETDYDHYLSQEVNVTLCLDTGDANYDFYLDMYNTRNELGKIEEYCPFFWLGKKLGYTRSQVTKAIKGDYPTNDKFLKSVCQEAENVTSSLNTLSFFGTCSLKELLSFCAAKQGSGQDIKGITISRGTSCGLYDPWNGSGSLLEVEVEKDVFIPMDKIWSFGIDGSIGYSIDSIYGMTHKFWENSMDVKYGTT